MSISRGRSAESLGGDQDLTKHDRMRAIENMISSGLHDDTPELRAWASTEEATPMLQAWVDFRKQSSDTEFFAVDFDAEERAEHDARELSERLKRHPWLMSLW